MINQTPDQAPTLETPANTKAVIVTQPKQLENLLAVIAQVGRVSEKQGDASGDWSTSGGDQAQAGNGQSTATTAREEAIAAIPEPTLMQQALTQHIQHEVTALRNQAKALTKASRPGAAFELTQIYAKIHRLNGMIVELLTASLETVKRLFIRVFIDRQSI